VSLRTDGNLSPEPRSPIGRVAIVVLAFDAPLGLLERSVLAVLADIENDLSGYQMDLVVIDNGSSARTRLAGIDVEVVETGSNRGYGGGMNAGIIRGLERGADAIALLNDDVIVEEGWMTPLIDDLQGARTIGSVQPTLLHSNGGTDKQTETRTVNSAGVVVDSYGAGSDRLRGLDVRNLPADPEDIQAFTGGAVVIHRDMFEDVGIFDERFFLYYEDLELARRAARSGWRHRHVPQSSVWHVGSATTERLGDDRRRLQERNRIWVTMMHGSVSEALWGFGLSIRRLRHQPRAAHWRALIEGAAGAPIRLASRVGHRCR
jgi:N-acetylglucosaminyl-diphospho-decaprenol L-rhamnosyltransferase